MSVIEREIIGLHRDACGTWIAELACGHFRQVRHAPPTECFAWVLSDAGRRGRLGAPLACPECNGVKMPPQLVPVRRSATFSDRAMPVELFQGHRTPRGLWARIVVEEGRLEYTSTRGRAVLQPGVVGVVEPETSHQVRPLGRVRFHLEYLRPPSLAPSR